MHIIESTVNRNILSILLQKIHSTYNNKENAEVIHFISSSSELQHLHIICLSFTELLINSMKWPKWKAK